MNILKAAILVSTLLFSALSHAATYNFTAVGYTDDLEPDNPTIPGDYAIGETITGSLTLTAALGANYSGTLLSASVVSFSFNDGQADGLGTVTSANSDGGESFFFATDGSGDITEWGFSVQAHNPANGIGWLGIRSNELTSDFYHESYSYRCDSGFGACDQAYNTTFGPGSQGSWEIAPIPLPAAAWLFASALLGLGIVKRKKP